MEQLCPDDFVEVAALLEANDLLATDIDPKDLQHFLGLREEDSIAAVGGFQAFGEIGLLRSIAISQALRGQGLGKEIVVNLEQHATATGIRVLYLLTETASDFFSKLDYQAVQRTDVPSEIRTTDQFSELCPESAICMYKQLPPNVKLERPY